MKITRMLGIKPIAPKGGLHPNAAPLFSPTSDGRDRCVAVVSDDLCDVDTLVDSLPGRYWAAERVDILSFVDHEHSLMGRNWDLLVISMESINGLYEFVEALMSFRSLHPGVPVLLVSVYLDADDYSLDRIEVCDVSVKAPVNEGDALGHLARAFENNVEWVRRWELLRHNSKGVEVLQSL